MKTSFSRNFSTTAAILLLSLLILFASFQLLARDYVTETTIADLQHDAGFISELASSYAVENSLNSREFLLNLDVASRPSVSQITVSALEILEATSRFSRKSRLVRESSRA